MTKEEMEALARSAAQQFGIDPDIYHRQLTQESNWNPSARSSAGAIGVAQFMPATARSMGIDPMDPAQAIPGGARLMRENLDAFGGDYEKALGAYNTGPRNIRRGIWPKETLDYVDKILRRGGKRGPFMAGASRGELGLREFDPMSTLYLQGKLGLEGEIRDANQGMQAIYDQPLGLERTPVPQQMGAGELGIGSLFSNVATAISGNPLYQQMFQGERMRGEEERRGAQAENRQIARMEVTQRRQEGLEMQAKRLALAHRRLEAMGEHERAMQIARDHDKVMKEIAQMNADQRRDEAGDVVDQRREEAFLRAGYRINAETGLPEQGGATPVKFARKDRQGALAEFIKLRSAKDVPPEGKRAADAGIRNMVFTRDEEDSSWKEYSERVISEARLNGIPPDQIMPLLVAKSLEYSEEMPGAQEAHNMFVAPQGGAAGAPPPEDIDAAAARAQAGAKPMKKESGGKQPEVEAHMRGTEAIRERSAAESSTRDVEGSEKNVAKLEDLHKKFPEIITSEMVAQAYDKLAKARKVREKIQNKGEVTRAK